MKRILIVGATSAIAAACARRWATANTAIFLVGRDAQRLDQICQDLRARGVSQVDHHTLDMNQLDAHEPMLADCIAKLGGIDIALIAHGTLPDQAACEQSVETALGEIQTNGISTIALLTRLANLMEGQRSGVIATISSVAGDRGRPSNYVYGTAKAAVSTFCEGLRARMFKVGVHVLTIKPGFVDTPMTAGLPLPKMLVATPDQVAKDIVIAIDQKKDTLYTLWFWRYIMLIIRAVPTFIFKKANL